MKEPDYISKDPFEGYEVVLCAACDALQYEKPHPLDKGGKYAWLCRSCRTVNEDNQVHLLQETAVFKPKQGL